MLSAKLRLVAWLALGLAAGLASGAEGPSPPQGDRMSGRFLRIAYDKDHVPLALQTAIVRYAPVDAARRTPTVDLVAVIHIAEKSYYQQLNHDLAGYDAVLYELVAPDEFNVPQQGDVGNQHPIAILQNGMKDILGLEFQLKGIDYTRKNMIHADMSPDQFAASMQSRGESVMTMLMRVFGYALTRQDESTGGASNGQLLLALFDKNRTLALKRICAEQFKDSEGSLMAVEGRHGSTLISGRNQVALAVLRKEIATGKAKIAILYGAAHMPNFQIRLRAEFGLAPVRTRWLVAWNLKP